MIAIIFYAALFGTIFSVAGLISVVIGIGLQEFDQSRVLFSHVIGLGFFSVAILLTIAGRDHVLSRLQGYYLCVGSWFFFPVILAFGVADVMKIEYSAALFNTYSAITTNGANTIHNFESTPKLGIIMLSFIQWIGGLAALITVTVILAPSGFGGLREDTRTAFGHSLISSTERLQQFAVQLTQVYSLISIACIVSLLLCGIEPYDAIVLASSLVSTGGIVPSDESLDLVLGNSGMITGTIFFLIGATSIFWHRMIVTFRADDLANHRESYYLLLVWLVLSLIFVVTIVNVSNPTGQSGIINSLSEGIFNAASIVGTSGLQSRTGVFALVPPIIILTFLFIGAGCYSTGGGLKMYRIGGIFSQCSFELNRLIYPSIARPAHFGSQAFDITLIKSIWSLFAAAVIIVFLGALALAQSGLEFEAAMIASIANFSTAGPAYGPEWSAASIQGWPDYFEMTPFAHVILSGLMLLGRLELIAVLALLNLQYWRNS